MKKCLENWILKKLLLENSLIKILGDLYCSACLLEENMFVANFSVAKNLSGIQNLLFYVYVMERKKSLYKIDFYCPPARGGLLASRKEIIGDRV